MASAVVVKKLSIRVDGKNILSELDFMVPERGITAIMGPMGGGKSTLLKFLAAALPPNSYEILFDKADYADQPISQSHHPHHIVQYSRDKSGENPASLKARLKDIKDKTRGHRDMLCIDEPTAGLEPADGDVLMQALRVLAKDRAVLMVSHNSRDVREYCQHVGLIGGGRVVTALPIDQFYDMITDPYAIHYICTGGLDLPDVETPILQLAPEHRETPIGFLSGPADPAVGVENWILPKQLSLMNIPSSLWPDKAGSTHGPVLSPQRVVFHFEKCRLDIYGVRGEIENTVTWSGDEEKPDRNARLTVEICRILQSMLDRGERITIDTQFNQNAVSAVLGAFLILRGFSPASALEATAQKLPALHLGMRIEEFLWNIDLELSM